MKRYNFYGGTGARNTEVAAREDQATRRRRAVGTVGTGFTAG